MAEWKCGEDEMKRGYRSLEEVWPRRFKQNTNKSANLRVRI